MGCKQSFGCCTSQCKINNTFKFSYIIKKKKEAVLVQNSENGQVLATEAERFCLQ